MYFENFEALLYMDGHGVYVWAAYAVTLVVVSSILIAPLRRRRRLLTELGGAVRRAEGDAAAGEGGS